MLLMEVTGTMTTATKKRSRMSQQDNGEWLAKLLSDVQDQVARYPTDEAIARVRKRVLSEMESSDRAAA